MYVRGVITTSTSDSVGESDVIGIPMHSLSASWIRCTPSIMFTSSRQFHRLNRRLWNRVSRLLMQVPCCQVCSYRLMFDTEALDELRSVLQTPCRYLERLGR